MKILVLGASGMAGHMITTYLREKGHSVTAVAGSKKVDNETIIIDVTNYRELETFLEQNTFEGIINCIGALVRSSEERKSRAVLINSFLPHFLEEYYKDTKTKVIHLSTDCVFSGEKGPYKLEDPVDSKSFYGRTKALGELVNEKDLTMRMSIIGPELREEGIGLFNWFMMQEGQIVGFEKVYWNGITTLELAKMIERILETPLAGCYHFSANKSISKYELLKLFKYYTHKQNVEIEKDDKKISNKVLIPSIINEIEGIEEYETMILEMTKWIREHKHLYADYHIEDEMEGK